MSKNQIKISAVVKAIVFSLLFFTALALLSSCSSSRGGSKNSGIDKCPDWGNG